MFESAQWLAKLEASLPLRHVRIGDFVQLFYMLARRDSVTEIRFGSRTVD